MKRARNIRIGVCLVSLFSFQAGCAELSRLAPSVSCATPVPQTSPVTPAAPAEDSSRVQQPVQLTSAIARPSPAAPPTPCAPFEGMTELSVDVLVEQVLARNPSLAQRVAAWQAASARYPQVISLDDPVFTGTLAPASIGSNDVDFGYRLEVSQRYPFPGKRGLRGQNALAEASAAGHDIEDVRLQLVESARIAFYDFHLVERALAVNEEALRLLKEFRDNAETRYRTGLVPQQDILQADVEIGRQRERQITLERLRQVAIARINTLMHLPPDSPLSLPKPASWESGAAILPFLPPSVGGLVAAALGVSTRFLAEPLLPVEALRSRALAQRPDLRALADRIAAEDASLALAYKEFYPDFEVMAAYDRFWQGTDRDLQPQLAARMNLPVRTARRHAAVAEVQARIAQRRAELDRQIDQVNFQVEEAYQQVRESERAVRLYEATILPAARENVKAAQAAYTTGKIPFLSLIEAQRNLVGLRDRYYESLADVYRRRATLERVTGRPLATGALSCPP